MSRKSRNSWIRAWGSGSVEVGSTAAVVSVPAGVGLGEGDGHAVLGGGEVEDGLVGLDRGVGEQRQGHRIAGPGRDPHLVVEDELGEIDVILECGDDHPGQSPAAANQHGQDQVMGARAGPGHVLHGRGELGCVGFGDPDRQQPVVAVGFGQHQQRTVPVGVDAESGYLHVDHRVSHPLAVSWHARAVIGGAVPVWAPAWPGCSSCSHRVATPRWLGTATAAEPGRGRLSSNPATTLTGPDAADLGPAPPR